MPKVPPRSPPDLDRAILDIHLLPSPVPSYHIDSSASAATDNNAQKSIENENDNDEKGRIDNDKPMSDYPRLTVQFL